MSINLSLLVFSTKEFRTETVEDASVVVRHPLAVELIHSTLIKNKADAITFGTQVLNLRKVDSWTWVCQILKEKYPLLEIGQTITIVHPRFNLSAGKNFIIKGLKKDSSSLFYDLQLFGPQP